MAYDKNKPEDLLYLLAFLDVIDRIDILLLEIRHLQQNIVHSLRAPALYLPLRYEEPYLFGEDWGTKLVESKDSSEDVRLLKDWVIRYPTPDLAMRYYNNLDENAQDGYIRDTDNPKKSAIKSAIRKNVGMIWSGDNWARQQRRQYHALYALQILKQQIMRDKLALARASFHANLSSENGRRESMSKPAFLILRQGVLHHITRYVSILKNHKQQMAESIEFGIDRNPTPSTVRRRDLGIFMDFLSNRCNDIQRDIVHLLSRFESLDDTKETMLLFHGWSQNERVSDVQMFDKVNQLFNETHVGNQKRNEQHVGYVNTSFWTPDRPDLQPIIANPIADTIINNVFQGLDDVSLSEYSDVFTRLIILFKKEMNIWSKKHPEIRWLQESKINIINDLASDFLAASVKGTSYLYALYLLRIGDGLENQLKVGDFVKLDMVEALKQGTAPFDKQVFWYLRLRLTVSWIRATNMPGEISELDDMLLKGVETVTEELLDFLIHNKPQHELSTGIVWVQFCDALSDIVQQSAVAKKTQQWRLERSKDYWFEGCKREGKKKFPRSTRRLNIRLQNYLFRQLLQQKQVQNKPLYNPSDGDIEELFNAVYPLKVEEVPIPNATSQHLRHPKHLFRHIYDIPYQCSLLRSIDMLFMNLKPADLFHEMHWDAELGRGLFSLALEFYAREIESPEHRLSLCINQVVFLYFSLEKMEIAKNKDLISKLEEWVKGAKKDLAFNKQVFMSENYHQLCRRVSHIAAVNINTVFAEIRKENSKDMRKLEQLAGMKLQQLLELLIRAIDESNLDAKTNELLIALVQFLSIRRNPDYEKEGKAKADFYDEMLHAFGDMSRDDKQVFQGGNRGKLPQRFLPQLNKSVMIHRHSITNAYPVPDPVNQKLSEGLKSPYKNKNGELLADILQAEPWVNKHPLSKKELVKPCDDLLTKSWITLGRFSAISKASVRLPCKCPLPKFTKDSFLDQEVSEEKFPPHFSRREITLPLRIIGDESEQGDDNMYAMLSLSLQRRSMRLDLLYRMIRKLNDTNPRLKPAALECQLLLMRKQGVKLEAFLTDGWGDILFFLSVEGRPLKKTDIDMIFDFQEVIFEDFMVDRTEILFTPQCLDQVSACDDYEVSLEFRIMEDRWLEKSISQHENNCKKLVASAAKAPSIDSVTMNKLPGRSDYVMRLKGKQGVTGFYPDVIRWLDGEYAEDADEINIMRTLDHLETCIEKVVIAEE